MSIQERLEAIKVFEATPFPLKGKTVGETAEFIAAKSQAICYYDDLVAKFGREEARVKLVDLFDSNYRSSILSFVDRVNEFLKSDMLQMVSRATDLLRFYADVFELVCIELTLLTKEATEPRRFTCGTARNRLKDATFQGRYDSEILVWFDNFLRNSVDHQNYNFIDLKSGEMLVWNTDANGNKIDSNGNLGEEHHNVMEYYRNSLELYFFLHAVGHVFWERA